MSQDGFGTYATPQVLNVQVLAPQVLLEFLRVLKKGFQCVDRAKNGLRLHTAAGYRYFNPRKPRCLLWIAKSSNNPAMCIATAASKRFETASTLRRSTSCIFQDLVGGNVAASPVSPQTRVEREVANIFWLRFKFCLFAQYGAVFARGAVDDDEAEQSRCRSPPRTVVPAAGGASVASSTWSRCLMPPLIARAESNKNEILTRATPGAQKGVEPKWLRNILLSLAL